MGMAWACICHSTSRHWMWTYRVEIHNLCHGRFWTVILATLLWCNTRFATTWYQLSINCLTNCQSSFGKKCLIPKSANTLTITDAYTFLHHRASTSGMGISFRKARGVQLSTTLILMITAVYNTVNINFTIIRRVFICEKCNSKKSP